MNIFKVGPTSGRKMVAGALSSQGCRVSERRVGGALRQINIPYHVERQRVSCIILAIGWAEWGGGGYTVSTWSMQSG